jgi:hypothetical protein
MLHTHNYITQKYARFLHYRQQVRFILNCNKKTPLKVGWFKKKKTNQISKECCFILIYMMLLRGEPHLSLYLISGGAIVRHSHPVSVTSTESSLPITPIPGKATFGSKAMTIPGTMGKSSLGARYGGSSSSRPTPGPTNRTLSGPTPINSASYPRSVASLTASSYSSLHNCRRRASVSRWTTTPPERLFKPAHLPGPTQQNSP